MAKLLTDLFYTALDLNGAPLSGAKLEFFITGTSTPLAIYTDDALAVAHTNPVVADSAGRFAPIYLQDADYKAILSTSADVVIDTVDPVHGSSAIPTTGTLSKSVDYTVVAGDKGSLILVDATSGDKTITLLGVTDEFTIGVKKIDSSANTVTIDGNAAETIDGDLTQVLRAQYDGVSLRSDAVSWHIESRFDDFPPATASKTASYEVLIADRGRTLLIDATTVTFAAGIQEDNSGASFIDETTDLNSAAANDVALFPAGSGDNDAFYFGSAEKFAGLSVNTGTIGVGTYVVSWEYWNGSWTALSGLSDGTDAFKVAGARDVSFQVPSDWATTTVNSQGPFYYIRARRNAGTVTTDPLVTQATVFTTVLLPPAATAGNGFKVGAKKIDATANAVTVASSAAETIDGALTKKLLTRYSNTSLVGDGTGWHILQVSSDAGIVPIETKTASASATIVFNNLDSTYDHYIIEILNLLTTTDDVALQLRVSTDNGATFISGASTYQYGFGVGAFVAATSILLARTSAGDGLSNVAGDFFNGAVNLWELSTSAKTHIDASVSHARANGTEFSAEIIWGRHNTAAVVDAVEFSMESGNIAEGVFNLYGVSIP